MKANLVVLSCTALRNKETGEPDGRYSFKLTHTSEEDAFGNRVKRTYYIYGNKEIAPKSIIPIEFDEYTVIQRIKSFIPEGETEPIEYLESRLWRKSDIKVETIRKEA